MRPLVASLLVLAVAACQRSPAGPDAGPEDAAVAPRLGPHGPVQGPPAMLVPCPPGDGDYLDRAAGFYDSGDYPNALACAVQATGAQPDLADAHSERAAALVATDRLEEARTSYARALALDPDHKDALLGAADLYVTKLPFSREFVELGLTYAERGRRLALRTRDVQLAAQLSVLAATALNDLGRAGAAAQRAEEALAAGVEVSAARYEKASALWELCRFDDARAEFTRMLADPGRVAQARYYLGLIAERAGQEAEAARLLAEARKLDPVAFPPEVAIGQEAFAKLVAEAVVRLPPEMRRDLAMAAQPVPVSTQDLPDLEDLTAADPPLSPSIVGLFRGPPLEEACPDPPEEPGPCRAIVLYRKNIARSVRDLAELERQVEVTLLHEIGHLRGEDDTQLVARGLE